MAGNELCNLIIIKQTYTFSEAIEHQKMLDKQGERIFWYDAKSGKSVSIGYTS